MREKKLAWFRITPIGRLNEAPVHPHFHVTESSDQQPGAGRGSSGRHNIGRHPPRLSGCASRYGEGIRRVRQANRALYDAMFTLATDLPFGRPEARVQLHDAFAEIRNAVEPLAGSRDPETLTEVVWSSLHGLASLARAGRLRPNFHEKRMAILVDLLTRVRG